MKPDLPTVMGDEHIDIASLNFTYELSSLFENNSTFPKFIHFTMNFLHLMIIVYEMEILQHTIKFTRQIFLLFPFQLFLGVLQKTKTNTILLSAGRLYKKN